MQKNPLTIHFNQLFTILQFSSSSPIASLSLSLLLLCSHHSYPTLAISTHLSNFSVVHRFYSSPFNTFRTSTATSLSSTIYSNASASIFSSIHVASSTSSLSIHTSVLFRSHCTSLPCAQTYQTGDLVNTQVQVSENTIKRGISLPAALITSAAQSVNVHTLRHSRSHLDDTASTVK